MLCIKRCCVLKDVGYTTSFNTQHLFVRSCWRISRRHAARARIRLPLHSSSSHPNGISPSHPYGISTFFFPIKIVSCNPLLTNCILQPPFDPDFFGDNFHASLFWRGKKGQRFKSDWMEIGRVQVPQKVRLNPGFAGNWTCPDCNRNKLTWLICWKLDKSDFNKSGMIGFSGNWTCSDFSKSELEGKIRWKLDVAGFQKKWNYVSDLVGVEIVCVKKVKLRVWMPGKGEWDVLEIGWEEMKIGGRLGKPDFIANQIACRVWRKSNMSWIQQKWHCVSGVLGIGRDRIEEKTELNHGFVGSWTLYFCSKHDIACVLGGSLDMSGFEYTWTCMSAMMSIGRENTSNLQQEKTDLNKRELVKYSEWSSEKFSIGSVGHNMKLCLWNKWQMTDLVLVPLTSYRNLLTREFQYQLWD